MNIVIPMAGRGTRLANHPSGKPKPLIEVRGQALWWWATSCLPLDHAERLVFVCLRDHVDTFGLDRALQETYADYPVRIVVLDEVTDGQLCTVLAAKHEFAIDAPLTVFNTDTWFQHDQDAFLAAAAEYDGLLGVGSAPGDRWSFARTDSASRVVEVAEKRRISDLACTGLYYFRHTKTFLHDAESAVRAAQRQHGEYYVAPLYNTMINRGDRVGVIPASEFRAIGTYEELAAFYDRASGVG